MINFVVMSYANQTTKNLPSILSEQWVGGIPRKGDSVIVEEQQYMVINTLHLYKNSRWESNVVLVTVEEFEQYNNRIYQHGGQS